MKKNIIICVLVLALAGFLAFIIADKRIVFNSEVPETSVEDGGQTEAQDQELTSDTSFQDGDELSGEGYIVVIDPGHQSQGNSEKEPVAPGSSEMKAKVSSGTTGISTGIPEYKVNLQVSLKLRDELTDRGYTVVMTRESDDVDISNSERAQIANGAEAGAFVRIHCNGSENQSVRGALTLCQTSENPYCGELYAESRRLSDCVLAGLCSATGAGSQGVSETDTMSGINWSQVPVTIVEMGYMTNPEEDVLLCSEDYQYKLAAGIADGIDEFFKVSQK